MLEYCRAVLVYISDKKIGAFTGPGKDDLRDSWEPVLDSLLNGVIVRAPGAAFEVTRLISTQGFLENSTKKTEGEYRACFEPNR